MEALHNDRRQHRASRQCGVSDATATEAMLRHISTWETPGVTDMEELFAGSNPSEAIGAWDTRVTDMQQMFEGASAFNQDISGWPAGRHGHVVDVCLLGVPKRLQPRHRDWAVVAQT